MKAGSRQAQAGADAALAASRGDLCASVERQVPPARIGEVCPANDNLLFSIRRAHATLEHEKRFLH
jgi:hypothetical protein